ncbi:MAG: hypothetical protein Ct9H300mP7_3530 [Verrucomicrobiota bacterium]|nr:MAG: hypothetical protein Ct9H300mP7_3530 [Verrucomicrobiota bacterium]
MGTPHGLDFSFVQGVVSARRTLDGVEMIQLAVPIEPGNSGGPMLDLNGRVHGVITMKSLVTENLGFAVPANLLKPLLEKPNPVPIERWMTIGMLNPKEWTPVFGGHWRRKGGSIHVSHGEKVSVAAHCVSRRAPCPRRRSSCRYRSSLRTKMELLAWCGHPMERTSITDFTPPPGRCG